MVALLADSDARLCGRVRRWPVPSWILRWMVLASRAGDGWAWVFLIAVLGAAGGRAHAILGAALGTIAAVNALQLALKRSFRRPRPSGGGREPMLRAPDRFSFPSGHSLNAFALAALLVPEAPWLAPPLLFYASSVAASRAAYVPEPALAADLPGALPTSQTLRGWETIGGRISGSEEDVVYRLYVDPQRPLLYRITQYRVTPRPAAQGGPATPIEMVIWN